MSDRKGQAIREWQRKRRRGQFSSHSRNLNKLRVLISESDDTEPRPASYWAELGGFKGGRWINPELKQLAREGIVAPVDNDKCRHWRKV